MHKSRYIIEEKGRDKLSRGVMLPHNVLVHTSVITKVAIKEYDFKELNQSSGSLDLASNNYYLCLQN